MSNLAPWLSSLSSSKSGAALLTPDVAVDDADGRVARRSQRREAAASIGAKSNG